MDGGAWWATVHGWQRVGHDGATSLSALSLPRVSLHQFSFTPVAFPYALFSPVNGHHCGVLHTAPPSALCLYSLTPCIDHRLLLSAPTSLLMPWSITTSSSSHFHVLPACHSTPARSVPVPPSLSIRPSPACYSFIHLSPPPFPCGLAGRESTCNAGDLGSIPGVGEDPLEKG